MLSATVYDSSVSCVRALAQAAMEWIVEDFVIPCSSRGDAEKKLAEGGNQPGLFLVRPKDATSGSFKVAPVRAECQSFM